MTVTERSRRRVADALGRLEREYGEFEVVEKSWDHPPDAYDRVRERDAAGTLGGAGVWTTDDRGRVLLVRHEDDDAWSDPGGKGEPGESLEATARRETREEAGVEVELSGVRQAHRIEIRDAEGGDAENRDAENRDAEDRDAEDREAAGEHADGENEVRPPIHRLIVIFDGEYVSGEIRPREGEIAEVQWWDEHPDELLYPELAAFPIPAGK